MIKRVKHAVDAINVFYIRMCFVVITLLFQLLAKHSPVALLCWQFVRQAPVNT